MLLAGIQVLILGDADLLLDMDIRTTLHYMVKQYGMPAKGKRQTLMFSWFLPPELQQLAADFMNDHIVLTVGELRVAPQQTVLEVGEFEKKEMLIEILEQFG